MNDFGLTPCPGCGSNNIIVDKLEVDRYPNWYVKCGTCASICTLTHAVKEEAIRQWSSLWCWGEIARLKKSISDTEAKERASLSRLTEDSKELKFRFETLMEQYIKYRMLYSGTAGNLNLETRRNLMIKEIQAELGWVIV